jgi:nitrous oxidase accessory protein
MVLPKGSCGVRCWLFPIFAALIAQASAEPLTLQERIDAAAPGETLRIEPQVFNEAIVITKPLKLIASGENFASQIRGNGKGKVVTIVADDVTLSGFRISGSGLKLMDDDAAIFITGNRATIQNNLIEDSLHGIYLKKTSGNKVLNNRIRGKIAISQDAAVNPENLAAGNPENCDADNALVSARRGNGIHQWNCTENLIAGNDISDTRDGIYFSFTTKSRVQNNTIRRARYGLHYMYSDENIFENNTFADNAGGAAMMFSKKLTIRGNHFIENRGLRGYGLLFQSVDYSQVCDNQIERNAVGLSFIQCNQNEIASNRIAQNYLGVRFDSNSDGNCFTGR